MVDIFIDRKALHKLIWAYVALIQPERTEENSEILVQTMADGDLRFVVRDKVAGSVGECWCAMPGCGNRVLLYDQALSVARYQVALPETSVIGSYSWQGTKTWFAVCQTCYEKCRLIGLPTLESFEGFPSYCSEEPVIP